MCKQRECIHPMHQAFNVVTLTLTHLEAVHDKVLGLVSTLVDHFGLWGIGVKGSQLSSTLHTAQIRRLEQTIGMESVPANYPYCATCRRPLVQDMRPCCAVLQSARRTRSYWAGSPGFSGKRGSLLNPNMQVVSVSNSVACLCKVLQLAVAAQDCGSKRLDSITFTHTTKLNSVPEHLQGHTRHTCHGSKTQFHSLHPTTELKLIWRLGRTIPFPESAGRVQPRHWFFPRSVTVKRLTSSSIQAYHMMFWQYCYCGFILHDSVLQSFVCVDYLREVLDCLVVGAQTGQTNGVDDLSKGGVSQHADMTCGHDSSAQRQIVLLQDGAAALPVVVVCWCCLLQKAARWCVPLSAACTWRRLSRA